MNGEKKEEEELEEGEEKKKRAKELEPCRSRRELGVE
jgi:hypothetical protein